MFARGHNNHYIRRQKNPADNDEHFVWGRPIDLYEKGYGIRVNNVDELFGFFADSYTNTQEGIVHEDDFKASRVRAVKKIWFEGGLKDEIPWTCDKNDHLERFRQVKAYLTDRGYPFSWAELGFV